MWSIIDRWAVRLNSTQPGIVVDPEKEAKRLREAVINPQMGSLGHKTLENPDIGEVLEAVGAICFNLGGKTLIEIQDFAFLHKAASGTDEKQLAELKF